jgi:hypothetical protein
MVKNWGWRKGMQEAVRFYDSREQLLEAMSSGSGGLFTKYLLTVC